MISASSMSEVGQPESLLCDNLEGWNEERREGLVRTGETHAYTWLIHADVWQKTVL